MAYIKQKTADDSTIVIVNTDDYVGELKDHLSITEHPEWFEIVEGQKPDKYTGLNYQSDKTTPTEEIN